MADPAPQRNHVILTTFLSGMIPVVVYMLTGMYKQSSMKEQDQKEAFDYIHISQYMGWVLFLQVLFRSFARNQIIALGPNGRVRPRFSWPLVWSALITVAFFMIASFWSFRMYRKFILAKHQDQSQTCKNLTRTGYTSGFFCYDTFPEDVHYYAVIEEVVIHFQNCSK